MRNTRCIFLFIVIVLLLSSCLSDESKKNGITLPASSTKVEIRKTPLPFPVISDTPIPSAINTVEPTFTIKMTKTHKPTNTTTLRPGSLAYMQTFPVWDMTKISTATQSIAGKCLHEYPVTESTPVFSGFWRATEDGPIPASEEEILQFINSYGVEPFVGENVSGGKKEYDKPVVAYQDFTNDGIPEIILVQQQTIYIYGCEHNEYKLLFTGYPDAYVTPPKIVDVLDINKNGIPEIYMITAMYTQGCDYDAIEWNGSEFKWLLTFPDGDHGVNVGPGDLSYEDIDFDGMKEVIVVSEVNPNFCPGYPSACRNSKKIFKWNGVEFLFYREIYDPPVYRFHAVEDGDMATIAGEYDLALGFYQQAIFSDELEWFSQDRFLNLMIQQENIYSRYPSPTLPVPDSIEYSYLAAYSYYRIILLHVANGYISDAQALFNSLKKIYPDGKPGSVYTKMAETFWDEYSITRSMEMGCGKALDYARQNWQEVIFYLGPASDSEQHFYVQSIYYDKSDNILCPFKDQATILHHWVIGYYYNISDRMNLKGKRSDQNYDKSFE